MSSDDYDRMVELVVMATDEGFESGDAREWLADTLEENDVIEFDDKHWVVLEGEHAFGEHDHPVS